MYPLYGDAWKGQTRSSESEIFTPCDCSLVLRLSPRALFRIASDRKLGGAWEQGYCDCMTFLDLQYDILSVCTAYMQTMSSADDERVKSWSRSFAEREQP